VIDIINDSGGENHHPLQVTPEFSLGTFVLMANTLLIDIYLQVCKSFSTMQQIAQIDDVDEDSVPLLEYRLDISPTHIGSRT
jgi:hypothetical protein